MAWIMAFISMLMIGTGALCYYLGRNADTDDPEDLLIFDYMKLYGDYIDLLNRYDELEAKFNEQNRSEV